MSSIDNLLNVEIEQGYFKEIFTETWNRFIEEGNKRDEYPSGDMFVAMPDNKHNYFEEAEDIDGALKDHWINTMHRFKDFCKQTQMQAAVIEDTDFPKEDGDVAMVSYGVAPYLSNWSPYHGALYTVILSLAKLVACGSDYRKVAVDFKECGSRIKEGLGADAAGRSMAAILGAYEAKCGFGLAGIDNRHLSDFGDVSIANCFGDSEAKLDFRSVAVAETKEEYIVTPVFKKPDNKIVRFCIPYDKYDRPIYEEAKKTYRQFHKMVKNGYIQSAYAVGIGGTMEALAKMSFGKNYGVRIDEDIRLEQLSQKAYGAIVAEIKPRDIRHIEIPCMFLGEVIEEPVMEYKDEIIGLDELNI